METTTLELELTQTGAQFTPLELRLPETMAEGEWAAIGRKLLRSDQVIQWWIGDWAAFGAGNPDKEGWRKKGALKEFCNTNGFDYGNVKNKCWVSNSIHTSLRRDSLPWSYFQEVAPLKPKDQRKWLDKAALERMPVADLRGEIRTARGDMNALESEGKSMRLLTKFYDDFVAELKSKPEEFWTMERKSVWTERLSWFGSFADEKLIY